MHFRPSGCEEKVADDLGPQLHSKKECESNDRMIHFVECSNIHNSERNSNTAQSKFLWSSGKVSNRISTELYRFGKRLGISRSCSDISSAKSETTTCNQVYGQGSIPSRSNKGEICE